MNSPLAVKSPSPGVLLFILLLVGAGLAGWFYGIHWKRVSMGDRFTLDETLLIDLQDQINALEEENARLAAQVRSLGGNPAEAPPVENPGPPPSQPVETAPVLPASPQKIETH